MSLKSLVPDLELPSTTRLIKDKKYPDMWRIKYSDAVESDMYNSTRAKQHLRIYKQREEENAN